MLGEIGQRHRRRYLKPDRSQPFPRRLVKCEIVVIEPKAEIRRPARRLYRNEAEHLLVIAARTVE
ncbi:hypothetical protein [uncultured Bradyrhizobium sp.]|uniref:hypothetical protein n=1 Tax=uncultured Bradyrhizobium sp. TaxID=199684 RepID=UPI00260E7FF8|nr:hypothetical protein [uncultured Bradyrhizobium sp.]